MSYNGSGTFQINTTGQPVVTGTVISSSAFNALTADLATGLSTAITKDGQTATTARIPFAAGISSTLVTDSTSISTGSIITAGGAGIAKALYVGTTANVAGAATLGSTLTYGGVTLTNAVTGTGKMVLDTNPTISNLTVSGANLSLPVIDNIKMGYTTTVTAGGTTTLTVSSNYRQFFTGTLAQTIVLPVTSTLVTGMAFEIENNSTGLLTVNSSGGNLVGTIPAGVCAHAVCIGTTLTTAADWDWDYISTTTITGTGANVLGTSPTITTPTISSLSSAAATALTLQSAGTTAITVDTSQNVGIGTASPASRLHVAGANPVVIVQNTGSTTGNGVLRFQGSAGTNQGGIGTNVNVGDVGNLEFLNGSTTNMVLTSSGNLLVGTTSNAVNNSNSFGYRPDIGAEILNHINGTASGSQYIYFGYNGSVVGSVTQNGTTGVLYNLTSDYRLKNEQQPLTGAKDFIMALKPKKWQWWDGSGEGVGFVAHEFMEVAKHSGNGEKDAVDKDGKPVYQSIQPSSSEVMANLVSLIQEQQALITALTARITALEAK